MFLNENHILKPLRIVSAFIGAVLLIYALTDIPIAMQWVILDERDGAGGLKAVNVTLPSIILRLVLGLGLIILAFHYAKRSTIPKP